jgi:hypothetical protein
LSGESYRGAKQQCGFARGYVRTTVLTTTLAALAGDSFLAGGNNPHLGRRAGSALAKLAGAVIGALLLRFGLAVPLLLGGIVTLAVTSGSAWLTSPFPTHDTSGRTQS